MAGLLFYLFLVGAGRGGGGGGGGRTLPLTLRVGGGGGGGGFWDIINSLLEFWYCNYSVSYNSNSGCEY